MMNKVFALILALLMIAAMAACGGEAGSTSQGATSAAAPSSQQTQESASTAPDAGQYSGTRIAGFFSMFDADGIHMVMNMEVDGETMQMEQYQKGNNACVKMQMNGETMSIITDGTTSYQIIDSEKMVMKMDVSAMSSETVDLEDYDYDDDATIETGSEEFRGEVYDFEKVTEDGETTTFYFKKGSDTLRYLVAEDSVMEIVSYDNNVPDSAFVIPADYQMMDMGDLAAMMEGVDMSDLEGLEGLDDVG